MDETATPADLVPELTAGGGSEGSSGGVGDFGDEGFAYARADGRATVTGSGGRGLLTGAARPVRVRPARAADSRWPSRGLVPDLADTGPYGEIAAYLSVHRGAEGAAYRTLSYFNGREGGDAVHVRRQPAWLAGIWGSG